MNLFGRCNLEFNGGKLQNFELFGVALMPARDDGFRERLLRALTGHPNGYRPAISPAEVIERHGLVPSHHSRPSLADRLRKLLQDQTRYPKR